jgi:hypothetical protein
MHAQELVVTHALGLRERSKAGVVIDQYETGKSLRNKVKNLLSKIMDKKAKGRFKEYKAMCQEYLHCNCPKLELPNDTRVSGVYRMYQSALRSKKMIVLYVSNSKDSTKFQESVLSQKDWQQIAETESLLRNMDVLAMSSQKEGCTSNVFSYYYVARARTCISKLKYLDVYDLDESWTPATPTERIPLKRLRREDLLDETKELIERFDSEFEKYFPYPDTDQILMMMLHPVMLWSGFRYVDLHWRCSHSII